MNLTNSVLSKTIFIVVENQNDKDFLSSFFQSKGFTVKAFSTPQAYIDQLDDTQGCLIADISTDSMDGSSFLRQLNQIEHLSPVVFIAALGSISIVVNAIKLGAFDFIEKPFDEQTLLQKVTHAIEDFQNNIDVISRYKALTDKEKQVFACIVLGATNQQMTEKLHISTSTVEKHRASVMKKMQAETLPCLVKMLPMLSPLNIDLKPAWCDIRTAYQGA